MRILFDHNLPRRFIYHLPNHSIKTTRQMGWETLVNGNLLRAAADAGFEAFLSIDKKLEHEQNLRTLPLPVIVIDARGNTLTALVPFAPLIEKLLQSTLDRCLFIIEPTGFVHRLNDPR